MKINKLTENASIKEECKALLEFAFYDTKARLTLFIIVIVSYKGAIEAFFYAPLLVLKILGGLFAGAKMANLATPGPDAAHNVLTKSL